MSGAGYSNQTPTDTATTFNQQVYVIAQMLSILRTGTIVQVKAVTNAGDVSPVGSVDVLPLVNLMDGNWVATKHGIVNNLPYIRIQGGGNAVICDPETGDIGLAMFCDRDISSVKSTKAQANPGSRRRFSFADGIYIGGLLNGTPTQYVQFNSAGITIADNNGNTIVMNSDGVTINGVLIDTSQNVSGIADLTSTGNASLGGGSQAVKLANGSNATKVKGT